MKINRSLVSLIISFLLSSSLYADDSIRQVTLYAIDYRPYMIVRSDTEITGIDVDVTKAAFSAVNVDAVIKTAPWKRILKSLKHGRIAGTLSCSKRPGRDDFILFSEQLSSATQVAVMAKQTSSKALIRISDMHQYSVTAVEGWGIQKQLERLDIAHTQVPSIEAGINAVLHRDIDLFYNGELTTRYIARQNGQSLNLKYIHFSDQESTPFYLCLSKRFSGSDKLADLFNQGLRKIKESGEFTEIYNRYL